LIKPKKILAISIKLLIGIVSFYIIYVRLSSIPHLKEQFLSWLHEPAIYLTLAATLLFMPANWGIECYKWKIITSTVERISYGTAIKSIFSGICVGNLAPGRAMEFLAKIFFFKPENRPVITVLHFINGMFQMLITVTAGMIALAFKLNKASSSSTVVYLVFGFGIFMIAFFCLAIGNIAFIQKKLKFIKWFKTISDEQIVQLGRPMIMRLLLLSVIRYSVFTFQFYLIYHVLSPQSNGFDSFASIAAYFMFTSLIPMVSFVEPAIRAAIALFVFNNASDMTVTVVLASTWVWIINVVIPSLIGYGVILKEKVYFRSANAH
jgi:hypothetical protein